MKDLERLLAEIKENLLLIDVNKERGKFQHIRAEYERRLQQLLAMKMASDFYVKPEVTGHFMISGTANRIDCCMFPKQHLIEKGFVKEWIGVEVKVPEPNTARAGKVGRLLWQAVIYSQSKFKVPKDPTQTGSPTREWETVRPAFILMFPDLLRQVRSAELGFALEAFAQQANVGSLELLEGGWKMIGAAYYFKRENDSLKLGPDHNCLLKRNVGSKR